MATTADIRKGLTINMEGQILQITDFQHVKPGKGGAFVRMTLKNVKTGKVIDRTINAGSTIDTVRVEGRDMQYLYCDDDFFHFMDQASYEQIALDKNLVGDASKWMKEGIVCRISFLEDQPLSMDLPNFLELKVTETSPAVRGDTVSGSGKPAILETGAQVTVPFFIEEGEMIRVDTRTREYLDRVK